MNKSKIGTIQTCLAGLAVICSVLALLTVISAVYDPPPRPMMTNTFHVATPAGEAFEVVVSHNCGLERMRLAAIYSTQNQSNLITVHGGLDILAVATERRFRLIENNKPDYQCKIEFLEFTNITTGE